MVTVFLQRLGTKYGELWPCKLENSKMWASIGVLIATLASQLPFLQTSFWPSKFEYAASEEQPNSYSRSFP